MGRVHRAGSQAFPGGTLASRPGQSPHGPLLETWGWTHSWPMELGGALWPTLTESPSEVITSFLTKEYPHQFQELRKPSCQRAPTLRWASQLFPRLTHGPSSLQGSAQVDDPLAPSHLEFKFEPEDFALPSAALGQQAGLGGALRQEAWCALALA